MRGSELLLAGNVQEKVGSPFGKEGVEGDGRLVRYFLPGDCTILRKTGKLGAWRMAPEAPRGAPSGNSVCQPYLGSLVPPLVQQQLL